MKNKLLITNHALLLLCASLYLGTGTSLVLFSFPVAPQLTPGNYYLQFVPQVQAATKFFTPVTVFMIFGAVIMTVAEWRQPLRWVPIVVLAAIIGSTLMETQLVFPLNDEMARHISDPVRLNIVLGEWMRLVTARVLLWCVEWAALAWYFIRWTYRCRYSVIGN